LTLDIEELLGQDWWTLINWCSGTIEDSTEHFYAHWHTKYITGKLASSAEVINSCASLENLYNGLLTLDFKDLTLSLGSVSKTDIYDFCVFWELDIVKDDKWTNDIEYSSVINTWGNIVVGGDCFNVLFC